jgi:hypothetical protein
MNFDSDKIWMSSPLEMEPLKSLKNETTIINKTTFCVFHNVRRFIFLNLAINLFIKNGFIYYNEDLLLPWIFKICVKATETEDCSRR